MRLLGWFLMSADAESPHWRLATAPFRPSKCLDVDERPSSCPFLEKTPASRLELDAGSQRIGYSGSNRRR
jgi:hypothetical protein